MLAKMPEEKGENIETFLDALNAFERKPSREIPSELEQLLCRIARNGEPLFPWSKLKPLVVTKLENVIQDYIQSNPCEEVPMLPNVENIKFDDMRERLLRALNAFNSAPFTMQRLCELLTHPKRYYQRSDKFMRGVEKNVQVVSTVTPTGKRITHSCEVRHRNLIMNGIPSDIHTQTSTPSADTQTLEEAEEAEEEEAMSREEAGTAGAHPNGMGVVANPDPTPDDDGTPSTLAPQEPSVDSTRETASEAADSATLCSLANVNERTTGSDDLSSSPADGEVGSRGADEVSASSSEAEPCKTLEPADHTVTGDSDDSDGAKAGEADQDSCSSLDSAESGDSSPDSALTPRTGYFDTLPPKDVSEEVKPSTEDKVPTESEAVKSTTDMEELPAAAEDCQIPETADQPAPDQSHYLLPSPPSEPEEEEEEEEECPVSPPREASDAQGPAVTDTAMDTDTAEATATDTDTAEATDTATARTDQSEETSDSVVEPEPEPEPETPMETESEPDHDPVQSSSETVDSSAEYQ